jgi:hypothetical protein
MVSFRIGSEIRAPPEFVVNWWWDPSRADAPLTPGTIGREVVRVDERTIRVTSHSEFGGRVRTTVGTMTRTGPAAWHLTAHVYSNGVVVSTVQTAYTVEPMGGGSRIFADFEFVGRTLSWRIVLYLSRSSLRRDRFRALQSVVGSIEDEFATHPSRPLSGTAVGPPPSRPAPPA